MIIFEKVIMAWREITWVTRDTIGYKKTLESLKGQVEESNYSMYTLLTL